MGEEVGIGAAWSWIETGGLADALTAKLHSPIVPVPYVSSRMQVGLRDQGDHCEASCLCIMIAPDHISSLVLKR